MINAVNVSIVLVKGDNFLLIKRSEDEDIFPGHWGIPGGGLEASDKDLESAVARECLEEIGAKVKITKMIANNVANRTGDGVLYIVYEGAIVSGTPKPLDGTDEVAWKNLKEAANLPLTPKTLDILKLVVNRDSSK